MILVRVEIFGGRKYKKIIFWGMWDILLSSNIIIYHFKCLVADSGKAFEINECSNSLETSINRNMLIPIN